MTSQIRSRKWYGGRSAHATSDQTKAARLGGVLLLVALGLSILFSSASQAADKCTLQLRPTDGVPGVSGPIEAMTLWDPDGDGPEPELLVVGGSFSLAGTTRVENVAAWDGKAWRPVGTNPFLIVFALEVYNGELIAAGWSDPFLSDVAIVRWDGNEWHTIGRIDRPHDGYIATLQVFNGDLIAAGYFTSIEGVAANSVARWNGHNWQSMGTNTFEPVPIIKALEEYNGELIAAGNVRRVDGVQSGQIIRWDGSSWHPFGTGNNIASFGAEALEVYQGDLIVGGTFYEIGGIFASGVARWDGSAWNAMDSGLDTSRSTHLFDLTLYDGYLIAVGNIQLISRTAMPNVAKWDGSTWQALRSGDPGDMSRANRLEVYNGDLYVSGMSTIYDLLVAGIARWDGNDWNATGKGLIGAVHEWTVYNGQLIAAGKQNESFFDGYLARHDGESWNSLGQPLSIHSQVDALEVFDGELIAAGNFQRIGGADALRIARWNGETWRSVGSGFNNTVRALVNYNGELIAGGSFTMAGEVAVNRIARWDGKAWQPLGLGFNGYVGYLIVFNDELIASGGFTTAGGVAARYIARWNGTEWQPLGGSDNNAYGGPMAVLNGELLALGPASVYGSIQVSKWNGAEWSPMTSVIYGYELNDLEIVHGDLYAAGWFSAPDGKSTRSLARWTGAEWELLGVDPFGEGLSLQVFNGELHLGGRFPYWGINDDEHSDYFFYARWGPDCAPGDMNCDGVIDLSDVPIFVAAMLEPEGESDCVRYLANLTGDVTAEGASKVDSTDIAAFVAALLHETTDKGRQPPAYAGDYASR